MTTRRNFLGSMTLAALTPALAGLVGCDDTSGGNEDVMDASGGQCASVVSLIGTNHGHTLTVPAGDVLAGASKTYALTSNGFHSHSLHVTSTHMVMLSQGATVVVDSTDDDGHHHAVTLSCGV